MAPSPWSTWVKWNSTIEQTLTDAQHLAAGEATVAEARANARKSGMAGVLDIVALSDRQLLGRCWLLSHDELHRHFGSKNPHKKAIEAGQAAFIQALERGQAVAITAFTKGVPTAVLFAGCPERGA